MITLESKSTRPSHTPAMAKAISMAPRRIGSLEVLIGRWPFSTTDIASRYDAVSGRWARTAHRFQLGAAYREPLLTSQVARRLAQALDCGVGTGSLSIALDSILKGPVDYHPVDTSAEMLAQANARMQKAGLRPHLQQADVLSLPYDDHSFDVVMAAHVLEQLPDPQRAHVEMVRVLKPGGIVFVCVTHLSLFSALFQLIWRTLTITEQQGVAWLHEFQLADVGYQPIQLGSCVGVASTVSWAQRPHVITHRSKGTP